MTEPRALAEQVAITEDDVKNGVLTSDFRRGPIRERRSYTLVAIAFRKSDGFAQDYPRLRAGFVDWTMCRLNAFEAVVLFDQHCSISHDEFSAVLREVFLAVQVLPAHPDLKSEPLPEVRWGWLEEDDVLADPSQYEKILAIVKEKFPPVSPNSIAIPDSRVLDHVEEIQRAEDEKRASVEAILGSISMTNQEIMNLTQRLHAEVRGARQAEITWREIGAALGISDTAAYRRFDPEGHRKHADYRRVQRENQQ